MLHSDYVSSWVTSGSVSFAGSARAAVVEHVFTRTKIRCKFLLTRNSMVGSSELCCFSLICGTQYLRKWRGSTEMRGSPSNCKDPGISMPAGPRGAGSLSLSLLFFSPSLLPSSFHPFLSPFSLDKLCLHHISQELIAVMVILARIA